MFERERAAVRFNERLNSWRSPRANRLFRKVIGTGGSFDAGEARWSYMTSTDRSSQACSAAIDEHN